MRVHLLSLVLVLVLARLAGPVAGGLALLFWIAALLFHGGSRDA